MVMATKKQRILITIPDRMVEDLNNSAEKTNLTKSQLITLCVKRELKNIVGEYEIKEQK